MLPTFLALRRILAASLFLLHARGEGDLRLVNGFTLSEGRVEIFYDGQWGTICDDRWEITDAHVVCQQLGLGYATAAFGKGYFGRGIGPIAMDKVNCIGDEERLDQCPFRGWFSHNCVHQEDAGVRCSTEDGGLRLVSGNTQYEGRIEVFYGGTWGTVCDDGWDINDAIVVCRKLGLGPPVMATRGSFNGEGTGEILLFNVNCEGTENGLEECSHSGFLSHTCSHNQDAGVQCSALDSPPTFDICNNYDVRVAHGLMESDGLVEVCYKGNWGTVCANSWKKEVASTICKQLGYNVLENFSKRKATSMVPTQIVEILSCSKDDVSLSNCDITFGNPRNCPFDAYLSCSGKSPKVIIDTTCTFGSIRLIESENYYNGKVQICDGRWLDLCGSRFSDSDSSLICKQLGYKEVDEFSVYQLPTVSKDIITASIMCSGTETDISQCTWTLQDYTNCVERVNLTCTPAKFPLSLEDSTWYWRALLIAETITITFSMCVNVIQCCCSCFGCCCCKKKDEGRI